MLGSKNVLCIYDFDIFACILYRLLRVSSTFIFFDRKRGEVLNGAASRKKEIKKTHLRVLRKNDIIFLEYGN